MHGTLRPPDGFDLTIDGERLHYVEQGSGEATVLIHGFPSSGELSYGRLLPLLPADRRVVTIDLAGLGWSDRGRQGSYDFRAQAMRILRVMDDLGIERATVVGSSFGGGVAQHVALIAPDRVIRLILLASLDASDPPRSTSSEWMFAAAIVATLAGVRMPWVGRRLRLKVGKPVNGWTPDWGEQEALDATRYTQMPGTIRSALKIMIDLSRAPSADIGLISAPTLIVSGDEDTRVPVAIGEALKGQINGSRHVILVGCPHGLASNQPQAVADLIARTSGPGDAVPLA